MKILHIMIGKEKFTNGVVDLYNENFADKGHAICYLMKEEQSTCVRNDILIPQYEIYLRKGKSGRKQYNEEIVLLMKKFDYTVLHSFCIGGLSTLYLFLNREFCNKHIIWIEWGFDLYDFELNKKWELFKKVAFYINKKVRENVNSIVCIFPPDCDYCKEKFIKSKAKVFYAPYMGGRYDNRVYEYQPQISRLKETKKNNETVYIQIGHNAQKQLNHIKALEALSKFSNENIMLVLPLSYSVDQQYVDQIQNYLESVFPGKYIVLKDFIPKEEYFKIICRIDIAIFYTYRQTALSNIYEMINNNVKLFMPEESVMKEYFCSLGIPITGVESIENQNFQQFTSIIEWEQLSGPQKFIDNLNDFDARLQYWIDIYEELRKTHEQ